MLDTNSVQTPSTPDFIIEYAQFRVVQNQRWPGIFPDRILLNSPQNQAPQDSFLNIQANKLTSPAIRYSYTTASTGWSSYVGDRLLRWAWLEWYKMEREGPTSLPATTFPLISAAPIPEDFETLQAWDYADCQIPGWYREWESQKEEGAL